MPSTSWKPEGLHDGPAGVGADAHAVGEAPAKPAANRQGALRAVDHAHGPIGLGEHGPAQLGTEGHPEGAAQGEGVREGHVPDGDVLAHEVAHVEGGLDAVREAVLAQQLRA